MRLALIAAVSACLLAAPALAAPGDLALEDVRVLSADAMQGRGVGTQGGIDTRLYILGRMRKIGLEPVDQEFTFKRKSGTEVVGVNLMARIPGTEPGGRAIVVTAHYDHLGVRGGQIYNGADDNASGVAGALAVAEAFRARPPRHDVWIVFLDAEESGLRGARAFVETPPVPLASIALNINFDMLSKNAGGELYAAGGSSSPWVKAQLEALAPGAPVRLRLGHDTGPADSVDNWTNQSDHGVFARVGVTWVYFGVEDHPEYHKPTDDFATIPQAFFRKAVDTVVLAARRFDDQLDSLQDRAT
jgi:Zn-dependent M28 family amino/carboxypeptidase